MPDEFDRQAYAPPQDSGPPDQVERDPAALSSAEDLDEDRLRVDPLEEGVEPPEHWSGVNKYGTTAWEQAHPAPLDERLAEEEPDVRPGGPEADSGEGAADSGVDADRPVRRTMPDELPAEARRGDSAGGAGGGSLAREIRTPRPPE